LPGDINLRAFSKTDGQVLWEDSAIVLGGAFNPGVASFGNTILAMSWIPDYEEEFELLGTGCENPDIVTLNEDLTSDVKSDMRNWILKNRLIDRVTGDSQWLPGEYAVSAFRDEELNDWTGDPNSAEFERINAESGFAFRTRGLRIPVSAAMSGYSIGGLWQRQNVATKHRVWAYNSYDAKNKYKKYHIDPVLQLHGVKFKFTVPAFEDAPAQILEFLNTDSAAALEAMLNAVPQIESATVSGGPFSTDRLIIEVTFYAGSQRLVNWTQQRFGQFQSHNSIVWYEHPGKITHWFDYKDAGYPTFGSTRPVMMGNGNFHVITRDEEVSPNYIMYELSGQDLSQTGKSYEIGADAPTSNDPHATVFKTCRLYRTELQDSIRMGISVAPNDYGVGSIAGTLHLSQDDWSVIDFEMSSPNWHLNNYDYFQEQKYLTTTIESPGHLRDERADVWSQIKYINDGLGQRQGGGVGQFKAPGYYAWRWLSNGDDISRSTGYPADLCDASHAYSIYGFQETSLEPSGGVTNLHQIAFSTIYARTYWPFGDWANTWHADKTEWTIVPPTMSRYKITGDTKWRIKVAGGSTAWMDWNVSEAAMQAAVTDTFGTYYKRSRSGPDEYVPTVECRLQLNNGVPWAHDVMTWQNGLIIEAIHGSTKENPVGWWDNVAADGCVGHYTDTTFYTAAENAQRWAAACYSLSAYVSIEIKNATPMFKAGHVMSVELSTGAKRWSRQFGETTIPASGGNPSQVVAADGDLVQSGTTIVGYSHDKYMIRELEAVVL